MATPVVAPSGRRLRSTSRRGPRGRLTFDRVSFFVVCLGLPLAIFLVFVISPFVQALYYSMTDWTGFSPKIPFIGFDNYAKLPNDDIFLRAVVNNILLAIVLPFVTLVPGAVLRHAGHGRRARTSGNVRGLTGAGFYRIVSFFPYIVPAIVIGLIWSPDLRPASGPAQRRC